MKKPLSKTKVKETVVSKDVLKEKSHAEELRIDMTDIDRELTEQPERYFNIARLSAQARGKVSSLENRARVVEAQLARYYRVELKAAGEKDTEQNIKDALRADPQYEELMSDLSAAQEQAEYLWVLTEAWRQRKDMLITLCANHRAEMDNTMQFSKKEE